MSGITTHVLDTARGLPAAGVPVKLETRVEGGGWHTLGRGITDADGRVRDILPPEYVLAEGSYRLTFDAASYFAAQDTQGFYAEVSVAFVVRDASAHYHVPLLLSPHGYTTYRGS
ncbi:MAG: 5-hydroxyisourate hydrolase [Acidobacteriota bacterium]|jgi:5-hydroxyisourate hydrolase|nr:5-hydroxyisourate hydrolase [Acidobacteriota bacterium]MDT7779058.1 5-hydroxyisourate hydrolase [Acidobacteriota bacterium]